MTDTASPPAAKKQRLPRMHKAAHDPRAAALVALSRVLAREADSQAALDEALSSTAMVPTDKGLCTELVYGVLRRYLNLDWFVCRFLSKPDKLPEEMRLLLGMALYEMAFLRIPPHASVGWAVNHVRHRFGKGLAGVANGALRNMQRQLADFTGPRLYENWQEAFASQEDALACRYALPAWIVRLWRESCGEEAALLLMRACIAAPPSGLRLNRARAGWQEARNSLLEAAQPPNKTHPVGDCALSFSGSLPWQAKELIRQGRASRQSAASHEILEAFSPRAWPVPVWDCCAGRGGKSLALLEQGVPVALASDLSRGRLLGLAEEYLRLGLSEPPCPPLYVLSAADAEKAFPLDGANRLNAGGLLDTETTPSEFGAILLDAPCSGLGTLARRPEIRLRRTPGDLETLVRTQKNILHAVWQQLRSGGYLVYLTCTVNPAENSEQIRSFLQERNDAALVQERQPIPESPLGEFFYGALVRKQ